MSQKGRLPQRINDCLYQDAVRNHAAEFRAGWICLFDQFQNGYGSRKILNAFTPSRCRTKSSARNHSALVPAAWLTGLLAPNFWLIRLGLLPLPCGLCLQFFCAFLKIFGHLHELKSARIIQREAIGQSKAQRRFFSEVFCVHGHPPFTQRSG